jgi:hypothetical protein
MKRLERLLESTWTDVAVALLLIVSSLSEGWETFIQDLEKFDLGVHHGVLLLGVVSLLRSLGEVRESARRFRRRGNDAEVADPPGEVS